MTGDRHVRFCASGRGRFPPATHQDIARIMGGNLTEVVKPDVAA